MAKARKAAGGAQDGAAAQTDEVTVRAITPIRHDGDDYAVGEEIVMTAAQAERLIASGDAEPAE